MVSINLKQAAETFFVAVGAATTASYAVGKYNDLTKEAKSRVQTIAKLFAGATAGVSFAFSHNMFSTDDVKAFGSHAHGFFTKTAWPAVINMQVPSRNHLAVQSGITLGAVALSYQIVRPLNKIVHNVVYGHVVADRKERAPMGPMYRAANFFMQYSKHLIPAAAGIATAHLTGLTARLHPIYTKFVAPQLQKVSVPPLSHPAVKVAITVAVAAATYFIADKLITTLSQADDADIDDKLPKAEVKKEAAEGYQQYIDTAAGYGKSYGAYAVSACAGIAAAYFTGLTAIISAARK